MPSSGEQMFERDSGVSVGSSRVAGAAGEGVLVAAAGGGVLVSARAASSGDGAAVGSTAGVLTGAQAASNNSIINDSDPQVGMFSFICYRIRSLVLFEAHTVQVVVHALFFE